MAPRKKLDEPDIEKMIRKLEASPAYRVAYEDREFIGEDFMRPVRLQLELLKPERLLERHGITSTIVCFGGTRIVEPSVARQRVKQLEQQLKKSPSNKKIAKQLQIAKAIEQKSPFYDEARKFGQIVTKASQNDHHEFVIVTGGGPGIMEASNRGAYDVGGKSIGLNITLPMEQRPNAYISPELCLQFHYFALRKMHFMLRAKALVAFPGGYGTLDEVFEALTLVQTLKVKPLPIILFGERFWKKLINFDFLVDEGTIDPEDVSLFVYKDTAVEAWDYIKYFYKNELDQR